MCAGASVCVCVCVCVHVRVLRIVKLILVISCNSQDRMDKILRIINTSVIVISLWLIGLPGVVGGDRSSWLVGLHDMVVGVNGCLACMTWWEFMAD